MRRITQLPDESLRPGLMRASEQSIITSVVSESGLAGEMIWQKTRKQPVVIARHMAMYFLTVNEDRPFSKIGLMFGKDHCSVINSRNAIENWILSDREMKLRVIRISQKIINSY